MTAMIHIALSVALGVMLAGCSSQLSWNDCMRDVDCKNATDQVMQANNVVHLTCPANPQKTTPACEAAMAALNAAEAAAFTKLKHEDAVDFSDNLLSTR